ncbi:unnamed protein product [Rotaria sp. Silwood2]|nr:unnamed protein product [Rotaria sp. Silwood2]CAF4435090.1 unnamed protein product [Rotaria sp. Silwood2]CAF4451233.1 unnamed protein product [Rotaria sp. Silwood2]
MSQYDQCSTNSACGCFHFAAAYNSGICGLLYVTCSQLSSCGSLNSLCYEPGHICVQHPRCHNLPVCYPSSMAAQEICPTIPPIITASPSSRSGDGICATTTWNFKGVTVAGGHGAGSAENQLYHPAGLFVGDDGTVYNTLTTKTDTMFFERFTPGVSSGRVVAGRGKAGSHSDLLNFVTSIVVDKNGTMFICDRGNRRVQRWFNNDHHRQTIIANISCWGLAMDRNEFLYVSHYDKGLVTKWPGTEIVAGGNGYGSAFNQFLGLHQSYIDRDQSVFVADFHNYRVMKYAVGSKEGTIMAGGDGKGDNVDQLSEVKYLEIMFHAR